VKKVIYFVLLAVCGNAYALTIDEIAGPWTTDMEATLPLLEAQCRKLVPDADDKRVADLVEPLKTRAANTVFEFTSKTILSYKEQDGAKTESENLQVAGLTTDQEALILDCKEIKLALRLRGDRLEMGMHVGPEKEQTLTFILKRPAVANAAPPAPAPAPKP
jgi:hypothetical protein